MKFIKWSPRKWIGYDNCRKVPFFTPQLNAVKVTDAAIHKMMRGGV